MYSRFKRKRIKDADHLKRVSEMACCICGLDGSTQAHHLLRSGEKGMGIKSGDDCVIPLCYNHHYELHMYGDETEFLAIHGLENPLSYARGLYYKRNEYEPFEVV